MGYPKIEKFDTETNTETKDVQNSIPIPIPGPLVSRFGTDSDSIADPCFIGTTLENICSEFTMLNQLNLSSTFYNKYKKKGFKKSFASKTSTPLFVSKLKISPPNLALLQTCVLF